MSVYGQIITTEDIEQAIVNLLRTPPQNGNAPLLTYYLAEVEREKGLRPRTLDPPPADDSYYGGIDFLSWQDDLLPTLIVNVQPSGGPERVGSGEYGQMFEIRIGVLVKHDDEDQARNTASLYGMAVVGAILQHGSLGGIANSTDLVGYPRGEFQSPDARERALAVATFHSFVQNVVTVQGGPIEFVRDPYADPGDWPTVKTTDFQLSTLT